MRDDIQGWRPVFRQIKDWCWYKDIVTKSVFIHILISVNTKDKKWHGITIKKGQMLTSRSHLADEVGVSVQNVRTALTNLQNTGEITCETTNRYTLITLVNDSVYDVRSSETNQQTNQVSNQDINQPTNQVPTSSQPTANQQPTTTKNNKDIKDKDIETLNLNNINNNNTHAHARTHEDDVFPKRTLPDELKGDMEQYMIICGQHGGEISAKSYQRSVFTLTALGHGDVGKMRKILRTAIDNRDKYLRPL